MLHINLETCSSTQSSIKEQLEKDPQLIEKDLIITTDKQLAGIGRNNANWIHFPDAISMSCILPTISPLTLGPLQVGLLASKFFKEKFSENVFLKWPNDLMTKEGKKVGGIICQLHQNKIIAGIGINIFKDPQHAQMPFSCDGLNLDRESLNSTELAKDLYSYLLKNFNQPFSVNDWLSNCIHANKEVRIEDEFTTEKGIFKSISPIGEAVLENNDQLKRVISGSLFII